MKAKKILAGICASLMLAATAAPIVSAADSVSVKVGSAEAKAGSTFSVKVDLADIPAAGINGCDFGIKYDSSVITITGVEAGGIVKSESGLDGVNTLETGVETGLVSVVYAQADTSSTNYIKEAGTFLVLSGKVSANAKVGDKSKLEVVAVDRLAKPTGSDKNSDILIGYLPEDNSSFVNYTPTITNGTVTVIGDTQPETDPQPGTDPIVEPGTQTPTSGELPAATKLGDVDLNGSVEVADIVVLAKYISNSKLYPLSAQQKANADCNRDGSIDAVDLSIIIEFNLGTRDLG